jgi:hypothetical protein
MGLPNAQRKKPRTSPDKDKSSHKVAVCAGTTQFDNYALRWIAQNRPHWQVNVLGRVKNTLQHPQT